MNYTNPSQSGRKAHAAGKARWDCPASYRTSANTISLWQQGWDAAEKDTITKWIELLNK